jgi:hypothetical protein
MLLRQGWLHNRSDLGASRSATQAGLGSPRSGEGAASDPGAVQRGGTRGRPRQQGKHDVHVFTYEGSPVKQVSTRAWYKALTAPVSRASAGTTYATPGPRGTCRTERHCMSFRSWGLGGAIDGAAVRTPRSGSSSCPCRETWHGHGERPPGHCRQRRGHKSVTATPSLKTDVAVSPRKTRMVARGGIEPPTRGFSVRTSTLKLCIILR